MNHPVHRSLKAAYSFYNVHTTTSLIDLMGDALILAKSVSTVGWGMGVDKGGRFMKGEMSLGSIISVRMDSYLSSCLLFFLYYSQKGFDVFNALDLMENKTFLEKLKFGIGDGNLQYYLYNWKCPSMGAEKVCLHHYQKNKKINKQLQNFPSVKAPKMTCICLG